MNIQSSQPRKVGLLFGKFYPFHCGHIYLIEKAVSQVDELHVMICFEEARDLKLFQESKMPKQPQVKDRFQWLETTFKDRHNIHIHILDEAGINSYPNGWKDWSDRVKVILNNQQIKPTIIFTSEPQDVESHSFYFSCDVKLVDANRDFINISATKIRNNPYQHWHYIAKSAQPFFVRIVVILDNQIKESLKQLANIYNTKYVDNGYINYIEQQQHCQWLSTLSEPDYVRIAILHAKRLKNALSIANRVVFTSIDFKILHDFYKKRFQKENSILQDLEDKYPSDLIINKSDFHKLSPFEMLEYMIYEIEKILN